VGHEQQLADLFEDVASTVKAPSLAVDSWARAQRVRRRRHTVIGLTAAGAVLAVAAASVLPLGGASIPDVAETASRTVPAPPSLGSPAVHQIPAKLPRRSLAGLPTDSGAMAPAGARKLSERPVDRAVAVVQPHRPEGATVPQPVYVLGADGTWARIDGVDLVSTRDADGNQADPLRTTSLSPDRRRVAIPQPNSLVVVDLTTTKAHRIAVAGFNEQVMWWGNRTVLVGQSGPGAVSVDWAAGTATPVSTGMSTWDSAAEPVDGRPVLELIATRDDSGSDPRRAVRHWQLDRSVPDRDVPLDESQLADGYGVSQWHGETLHNGAGRLVRAGWGTTGTYSGIELLAVVNAHTGVVERLLDLGRDRYKGCCRPLEWVDDDTVLVHTDKEGLITWNVRTGAVAQVVAGPILATVSIRPPTS
jgi:hypothetical protein